ncbi:MAG: ACP S-malonyltransferase [Candidatus Omnitrophota bacterium]
MVGYLFAGQGSQNTGMGKDLYAAFPQAKAVFDKADEVLGFPLSALCFEGPQEELTKTNNCQPAIVTMSIACWEAYRSRHPEIGGYMAGLSLGEYSALVACGALKFEDAVYLVRRRGEFMEEAALKSPGKMLSVIGLELAKVREICAFSNTEVANINCPGQVVISGSPENIENAQKISKEKGAKLAVILDVSGAFHSSFMQEAGQKLAVELEKTKISQPEFPVVSNCNAKVALNPQEIKENLVKQVAQSVLWEDSMRLMLSEGIRSFVEFGPGKVLKGLMRRIDSSAQVVNVEKKADIA